MSNSFSISLHFRLPSLLGRKRILSHLTLHPRQKEFTRCLLACLPTYFVITTACVLISACLGPPIFRCQLKHRKGAMLQLIHLDFGISSFVCDTHWMTGHVALSQPNLTYRTAVKNKVGRRIRYNTSGLLEGRQLVKRQKSYNWIQWFSSIHST